MYTLTLGAPGAPQKWGVSSQGPMSPWNGALGRRPLGWAGGYRVGSGRSCSFSRVAGTFTGQGASFLREEGSAQASQSLDRGTLPEAARQAAALHPTSSLRGPMRPAPPLRRPRWHPASSRAKEVSPQVQGQLGHVLLLRPVHLMRWPPSGALRLNSAGHWSS